ncbi:hypothetical protein ACHWQZ_G012839 [Mnemiopsis leidyi]
MSMATASLAPSEVAMESEEDEVLHELDVYITKSLGKLLLAQYPLRPTYKPYQNAARDSLRMRPVQCELEVDMKIQSNPNKPAQIQKLTVSQRPMLKPHSAIGLVRGNELHLSPLDSVVQLTPSFDHIDKRVAEDAKLNEVDPPEATTTQSVTRKFTKVESDRDKAIRLSSYQNIQQERQSESWVPCDYRPPEHPYTAGQKRALLNKKEKKGVTGSEVSRSKYLDMFLPEVSAQDFTENKHSGLRDLPKLSTADQVETLLRNTQVLSFAEITQILPSVPKTEILTELQNCAHLVQGHWVISSKLLYPKGSKSGQTGVPAELMIRHRNFILYCFVHNPLFKRKYLQPISRIPPTEIEEILKQISTFTPHDGWTFKKAPCTLFTSQYPDIEQFQKVIWSQIYDDIYLALHLKAHRNNPLVHVERKVEKHCVNKELTSISVETAQEIISRLQLSETVELHHLVELSNELREVIGPAAVLVEVVENSMYRYIPPEHCKAVLSELCRALRLCYINVLTQEGEREQALGYEKIGSPSDKYRHVIFSLFESRYQISKSELRDTIHKRLQTTLTSKEYHGITSVLCESPTVYKSGHWVLRVKRTPE